MTEGIRVIPLPYEVIKAEDNPLYSMFGNACLPMEQGMYRLMDQMATREHYQGGQWEFRKYANNALCMVFPDNDTIIKPILMNGYEIECSLEAVSYGAWFIVLSMMSYHANEKGDSKLAQLLHDQYHGLLDAISGRIRFVITPSEGEGYRDLTPDEEESFLEEGKLRPHPEKQAIGQIID